MSLKERIDHLFWSNDHKKIMLHGLFVSTIITLAGLAALAAYEHYTDVFWQKIIMMSLMIMLFLFYIKIENTPLFSALYLFGIELESSSAMLSRHFYDYATVYPFFVLLGFYFFFALRTAVLLTLLHFVFWTGIVLYGFSAFSDNPLFDYVPMVNMTVSTFVVLFIGVFYNISTEQTYMRLKKEHAQKEVLLKEIHHRIKNNLNRIASLLGLQMVEERKHGDKNVEEMLFKNKLRIEAMAMVHKVLYSNNDFEYLDVNHYLQNLTHHMFEAYDRAIAVTLYIDALSLPLETMSRIGIIINVLYTNTVKYARSHDKKEVMIVIDFHFKDGNYVLTYHQQNSLEADLGVMQNDHGIGMKLIAILVEEMDGSITFENRNGLIIRIIFPRS